MATHSSVFAWRIPGMGEHGGLTSLRLHRVGHDWNDLAAAAALLVIHTTKNITITFKLVFLVLNVCSLLTYPVNILNSTSPLIYQNDNTEDDVQGSFSQLVGKSVYQKAIC